MRRLLLLGLLLLSGVLLTGEVEAQTPIITSSAPDRVALTVYRSPYGRGRSTCGISAALRW